MDGPVPHVAPAVGTPVRGGLTYREAHLAMALVAESGSSARWVTPILERQNATASLAVELAACAFGSTTI
jgi:arginase